MDKQLFNDIVASMNEAIAITKGEQAPSRVFTYERPNIKEIRAKTGLPQIQFAKKTQYQPQNPAKLGTGHTNPNRSRHHAYENFG